MKYLVVFCLLFTVITFAVIWAEDVWNDFYQWGPPFKVGSINIRDWTRFGWFVALLVVYQGAQVVLEETYGRKTDKQFINEEKWSNEDVFILACYNLYKWLGTILHILIAVTRIDVWFLIAIIDTLFKGIIWYNWKKSGRTKRTAFNSFIN